MYTVWTSDFLEILHTIIPQNIHVQFIFKISKILKETCKAKGLTLLELELSGIRFKGGIVELS